MPSRFALAVFLSALSAPLAAQEHVFGFHGGDAGTAFDLTCGTDGVLVGISGKANQWVDQLTARCVKVKSNGDWNGSVFTRGPAGGTSGTSIGPRDCPAGSAVAGISGRHGWYLHSLRLACYDLGANGTISGGSTATLDFGVAGGDRSWTWEVCPNAKPGKGFRGRSGWYVDAIRFVCHDGTGYPRTAALVTAAPVLVLPQDLYTLSASDLRPAFQWLATPAARRYRLCIRRNASTACDVLDQQVSQPFSGTTPIPINTFRPSANLQFGGVSQVTWLVIACNDHGCGPWSASRRINAPPTTTAPTAPTAPTVAFSTLSPTFRHARCMNCHAGAATNFVAGSVPGLPAGHQAVNAATNCQTCHTNTLLPASGTVNPGWHSPPARMDFRNRTDQSLCDSVKALGSSAAVATHLKEDKLVLWAVGDGRRPSNTTPLPLAPPGSITGWRSLVDTWVNAGMSCN
jgi:hypothetical protein